MKGRPGPTRDAAEGARKSRGGAAACAAQRGASAGERVELARAAHSQESAEKAIAAASKRGVDRAAPALRFARLRGGPGDLTRSLGKRGFRARKHLPRGGFEDVANCAPRLTRRENAVGSKSGEITALRSALLRRVKKSLGAPPSESAAARARRRRKKDRRIDR